MRVRPLKRQDTTPARPPRRLRTVPSEPARREPPAPEPAPEVQQPADPALKAERRYRAAGGPKDKAWYRCDCGYQFEADVSTSVACPHCGSHQAW